MRISRIAVRAVLLIAGLLAVGAAAGAFYSVGARDSTTWAVTAAAMAVVSSVASAWTSRRVIELQEDAAEPLLVASVDLRSRYDLAQFRITNRGGSAARDLTLVWKTALLTSEGQPVTIGTDGRVALLSPGDYVSAPLGISSYFIRQNQNVAEGTVAFRTAKGSRRSWAFQISADHARHSYVYDEELPKTLYELQKIPKALDDLASEVARLRHLMERRNDQQDGP